MRPINFIQNLKQCLWDIEQFGGNITFHVSFNYSLLVALRSFVLDKSKKLNITFVKDRRYRDEDSFIDDVLNRDRFEKRIQYCIIKLQEFKILEKGYYKFISKALGYILQRIEKKENFSRGYTNSKDPKTIEQLIIDELIKCFASWYYPEDIYTYEFANDHNLIVWNYPTNKYHLTNIGRYFIQLSSFESIIFLASLEITFGRANDRRYLNKKILDDLISEAEDSNKHRRIVIPNILRLFGIVDGFDEKHLTDFGLRVLEKLRANINALIELNLLLNESEISGFQVAIDKENSIFQKVMDTKKSKIFTDSQKESIETAIKLYKDERFLDCLRIFYSNIESVLNEQLLKIGETPSSFRGMRNKIEKLEKESILSSKLSSWLEVVTSRNKIIHSNIDENDSNVLKPLIDIVGTFWNKLTCEIEAKNTN
jgi:archaellum component FlaC